MSDLHPAKSGGPVWSSDSQSILNYIEIKPVEAKTAGEILNLEGLQQIEVHISLWRATATDKNTETFVPNFRFSCANYE